MKCPNCGLDLPEDSDFCQYCGSKVGSVPSNKPAPVLPVVVPSAIPIPKRTIPVETPKPAPSVIHSESATSSQKSFGKEKAVTYCKKCGGTINPHTNTCESCGKHYVQIKKMVCTIALIVGICALIGLNIFQYVVNTKHDEIIQQLNGTISEQQTTIADRDASIASRDTQIASLKKDLESKKGDADSYQSLVKGLSTGKIGAASNNFKLSESVIVLNKYDVGRKVTLTTNWSGKGTVSINYSPSYSSSATFRFDEDSWYSSTKLTVVPKKTGVTVATFSNTANSETFKVIIIVK